MIIDQIRHLINTLPQTESIDVNLKFVSDEKQFQKAIDDTFGRFYTHKELKMNYLNNLTNNTSSNNTIINTTSESNGNISAMKTAQKIQQLQKQYSLQSQQLQQQQQIQHTTANVNNVEQEWLMMNMLNAAKKQQQQQTTKIGQQAAQSEDNLLASLSQQQLIQLQQYLQQQTSNSQMALSPSDSTNDDWLTNIVKLPSVSSVGGGANGAFDDPAQKTTLHPAISPAQSSGSSSSNSQSQWPIGGKKAFFLFANVF